tara:strand:- start:585 stop:791 length:207 start_codon:yes stop_codon:yes gene_type:complete
MMHPHKLDTVFNDVENLSSEFTDSPAVQAAFSAAQTAYQERNGNSSPGPAPEQAALSAFLDCLDLQRK